MKIARIFSDCNPKNNITDLYLQTASTDSSVFLKTIDWIVQQKYREKLRAPVSQPSRVGEKKREGRKISYPVPRVLWGQAS